MEKIRRAALPDGSAMRGTSSAKNGYFSKQREFAVKLIVASAIAAAEKHERDVQYFKRH